MKNPNVLTSIIIVIILQISFSANAQSGKVDFKAEQQVTSIRNYPSSGAELGIVKAKKYLKFTYLKGKLNGCNIKKRYEFGTIGKSNSTTKVKTTEFKSFVKKNKYQFSGSKTDL